MIKDFFIPGNLVALDMSVLFSLFPFLFFGSKYFCTMGSEEWGDLNARLEKFKKFQYFNALLKVNRQVTISRFIFELYAWAFLFLCGFFNNSWPVFFEA